MFWDLKGATLYPSCINTLQSPAVRKLFPEFDMVPCTMIAFANPLTSSHKSFTRRICAITAGSLIFASSANISTLDRISAVFGSSSAKGRKIRPRC